MKNLLGIKNVTDSSIRVGVGSCRSSDSRRSARAEVVRRPDIEPACHGACPSNAIANLEIVLTARRFLDEPDGYLIVITIADASTLSIIIIINNHRFPPIVDNFDKKLEGISF